MNKETSETGDLFGASTKNELQDDFQTYWTDFRNAIIDSDSAKLIKLTRFPLLTHGVMDEDPQFPINEDNFYYFLKICLSEDTGMLLEAETNLDFIKRSAILNEGKDFNKNNNWCRINAMEFQRRDNKWGLTLIYFNTADYIND